MTRFSIACGAAALAFAAAFAATNCTSQDARRRRVNQEGVGDSRTGHHARHSRRHQRRRLHAGTQLHAGSAQSGQPAQDDRRRPRRGVLHRLRRPRSAHARRLRQRLQAGDREVRRDPPADREDRAGQDRAGADRRRRPADQQDRQEGRAHRRRERLLAWRCLNGGHARQGVPRPRRALSLARAQRSQPARRLEYRRGEPASGCTTG